MNGQVQSISPDYHTTTCDNLLVPRPLGQITLL